MPGPYPFPGVIIIDPATNAPGPGATVLLYDPLDTAYATPQEITDAYGSSLGVALTAGAGGWSGRFIHPSLPILNAKPGAPGDLTQPSFEIISGAGLREDGAAARVAAEAAAQSAELAAARADLADGPTDNTVATLFADTNSLAYEAGVAAFGGLGTGDDPNALHRTTDESASGQKTFTTGVTIPSGATLTVATGGTLALPDGGITAIIKVNGLTGALSAKADASALATTNDGLAGKVDGTPYNGFDMVALPVGVTTIPADFGTGLIIYLTD